LRHADAGKQCQRAFHQPDHAAERDIFAAPRKLVSTTSPALTVNQAIALQFDKNGLEDFPGMVRRAEIAADDNVAPAESAASSSKAFSA
jgi:hypothetical protein